MSDGVIDRLLHTAPFWLLAAIVVVGMAGSTALGWWLRQRRDHVPDAKPEDSTQEGYVVSAVLGLLALLIGFTFSLAIDRFDTRRERVLLDANAIATTYLRAQLLDAPHRARISALLVRHTDLSIELSHLSPGPRQSALLAQDERLITELWVATRAAFPSIRGYDFSSTFLESVNEVIALDAARQQARRARVPSAIFLALILYQLIASGLIGYVLVGRGAQRAGVLLLVLFGISLILVIDVDYPNAGAINVSQEPMERLKMRLHDWPPAVFGR